MNKAIATVGIWIGVGALGFAGINAVIPACILTGVIWIFGSLIDMIQTIVTS